MVFRGLWDFFKFVVWEETGMAYVHKKISHRLYLKRQRKQRLEAYHIWDEYYDGNLSRQQATNHWKSLNHPFFVSTSIGDDNIKFLLDTADQYREVLNKQGVSAFSKAYVREVAFFRKWKNCREDTK